MGGTSPMPPRKVTQTESNNGIPRKADELLSSLGHQVDSREIQRITQVTLQFAFRVAKL